MATDPSYINSADTTNIGVLSAFQSTARHSSGQVDFAPPQLPDMLATIKSVATWTDLWDGVVPSAQTINYTVNWLARLYMAAHYSRFPWQAPHVGTSPEGDILLELYSERKKLTIYLRDSQATYIKVWGPDIENQMADGDASATNSPPVLWDWLHS